MLKFVSQFVPLSPDLIFDGYSALCQAARAGSLAILEFIEAQMPEFPPHQTQMAIQIAFAHGHPDVVQYLIAKVEPAFMKLHICSTLRAGCPRGTRDVGELLIPFMSELDDIVELIVDATTARNIELAELWIDWQRERNPDLSLDRVCVASIQSYSIEIARFLGVPSSDLCFIIVDLSIELGFADGLQFGFDGLSDSQQSGLLRKCWTRAVASPHAAVVTFFFKRSRLNWRDALWTALRLGDRDFLRRAVPHIADGAQLNILVEDATPLSCAADWGELDLVEALLSIPGIDPTIHDYKGNSAFRVACGCGHVDVFSRLVQFFEDDPYEINAGFFCASHCLALDVRFELIPFFSQFPCLDANFQIASTSVFQQAASLNYPVLLEALLALPGIEVNARDWAASTALMRAIEARANECVDLLIADPRVDLNAANKWGWSALPLATATGSWDLAQALLASDRLDLRAQGGTALAVSIVLGFDGLTADFLTRPDVNVNAVFPRWTDYLPSRVQSSLNLDPLFAQLVARATNTPSSCLQLAIDQGIVPVITLIMAHPTFDPVASRLEEAVFRALLSPSPHALQLFLGNDLTVRTPSGRSLLAAGLSVHATNVRLVINRPDFDVQKQDPMRCVQVVAKAQSIVAFGILADLPGIDLNFPIPHGTNGFPDERGRPQRGIRAKGLVGRRLRQRARVGVPAIFSIHPSIVIESAALANPRVDLDRRGKHGETILFQLMPVMSGGDCAGGLLRMDRNARDRHGNTALHCVAIAVRNAAIWKEAELPCDAGIRNENGDTTWALLRARARRRV
jgi:ankyrin repeat protein